MAQEPRVLIVDDDADLAEVTCELIGMAGIPAIYCTTVVDATDTLARHGTSIVALVTDINMGSPLSGIDLAIFVAQQWPRVAICVTSGFDAAPPRRLPEKAAFLSKPWRVPDVLDFLRTSAGLSTRDTGVV